MDIVYLKVKDLTSQEFEQHKTKLNLEEGQTMPVYHPSMVFAYGIDAEDYILGGEEINYWPVILDLANQDIHDLQFDQEDPPVISQEQLDNLEIYAYEDSEENEINWYYGAED